jgi:hypothetical protein
MTDDVYRLNVYHLDPTPDQIERIGELIEQLSSEGIDKLWKTPDGWTSTLDFWLSNYGRAEELINNLESFLNKEGTY